MHYEQLLRQAKDVIDELKFLFLESAVSEIAARDLEDVVKRFKGLTDQILDETKTEFGTYRR